MVTSSIFSYLKDKNFKLKVENKNNPFKFNYKNTIESEVIPFDMFFNYPTKSKQGRLQFKISQSKKDLFFWLLLKKDLHFLHHINL